MRRLPGVRVVEAEACPGRSKLTADAVEGAALRGLSKPEQRGEADRARAIFNQKIHAIACIRKIPKMAKVELSCGALNGCIATQQAPSSGGAYFGNRKPMRLMALPACRLALAAGLGVARPGERGRRAAHRGSRQGAPRRREPARSAPGETVWVALHLEMRPGWHVYWRNPGDAGLPPEIAWKLPSGFTAGEIAWPTPERFVDNDQIGNYGYAGSVDLLVPVTGQPIRRPPIRSFRRTGGAPIRGACDLARLLRYLHSGRGGAGAYPAGHGRAFRPRSGDRRALFAAARARLPHPAGFATRIAASGTDLTLRIPAAALAGLDDPTVSFFPTEPNLIDAAAEPRTRDIRRRARPAAQAGNRPDRRHDPAAEH